MEFLTNTKADAIFDELDNTENGVIQSTVHIWLRQRNRSGRKYITEVEGLAKDLNLKKIMRYWRHDFHCSVTKIKNIEGKTILKLQGNQQDNINKFLLDEKIIDKSMIKIHGF